jgi:hypothetical protein
MKRMDSLKRPETVISLVNTAALLGASIYFYRKINNLELELNKHSEHLVTTVRKVREMTVYKKHISALGNAIKELNGALGNSYRDVETLKELVKYQSAQILELQAMITKLDTTENKLDIKMKENPYLRSLVPAYPARNNPRGQQQFPQPILQPVPVQQPQLSQYSHGGAQLPQYSQPMQPQYSQPQQPQYSNQPQQPQYSNQPQQPQYSHPQPMQSQYSQPMQSQYSQPMHPQYSHGPASQRGGELLNFGNNDSSQHYGNNNFSDEGIDDEDAAIDAVRRARQQSNDDPLGFL